MTKTQFLKNVQSLYRVANLADSDSPDRADWTKPDMAGNLCCKHLDKMLHDMLKAGIITNEDFSKFHDTL
jgi:hypothetical protein